MRRRPHPLHTPTIIPLPPASLALPLPPGRTAGAAGVTADRRRRLPDGVE
jgi:hypothetical protein